MDAPGDYRRQLCSLLLPHDDHQLLYTGLANGECVLLELPLCIIYAHSAHTTDNTNTQPCTPITNHIHAYKFYFIFCFFLLPSAALVLFQPASQPASWIRDWDVLGGGSGGGLRERERERECGQITTHILNFSAKVTAQRDIDMTNTLFEKWPPRRARLEWQTHIDNVRSRAAQ